MLLENGTNVCWLPIFITSSYLLRSSPPQNTNFRQYKVSPPQLPTITDYNPKAKPITYICKDLQIMNLSTNKSYETANHGNRPLLQWTQWQLLDSILPTGGFAHSYGLESAMQSNIVKQPEDLKPYIIQVLDNTGSLLLPFVHTLNKFPDTETWTRLDNILEATRTNEIARRASASQGSALLRVAASVFHEIGELKSIRERFVGSGLVYFHHACVFGLLTGLLGFDGKTSQCAYVFLTMRDVLSAATRQFGRAHGSFGATI